MACHTGLLFSLEQTKEKDNIVSYIALQGHKSIIFVVCSPKGIGWMTPTSKYVLLVRLAPTYQQFSIVKCLSHKKKYYIILELERLTTVSIHCHCCKFLVIKRLFKGVSCSLIEFPVRLPG